MISLPQINMPVTCLCVPIRYFHRLHVCFLFCATTEVQNAILETGIYDYRDKNAMFVSL